MNSEEAVRRFLEERESAYPLPDFDGAICPQTDPDIFFPEKGGTTKAAKRVCIKCPPRAECLVFAMDNGIQHGVWGGKSERERHKMRRVAA